MSNQASPSGPFDFERAHAEIMSETMEAIGFATIVTQVTLSDREAETCAAGANMAIGVTIDWLRRNGLLRMVQE